MVDDTWKQFYSFYKDYGMTPLSILFFPEGGTLSLRTTTPSLSKKYIDSVFLDQPTKSHRSSYCPYKRLDQVTKDRIENLERYWNNRRVQEEEAKRIDAERRIQMYSDNSSDSDSIVKLEPVEFPTDQQEPECDSEDDNDVICLDDLIPGFLFGGMEKVINVKVGQNK